MNFEQIQSCWTQLQPTVAPAEEALREVQTRARQLHRTLLRRDLGEIAGALFICAAWGFDAFRSEGYARLGAGLMVAIGAYLVVRFAWERLRARRRRREYAHESLLDEFRHGLEELEHQIRLLRSVLWWYLLPLGLGIVAWSIGDALENSAAGWTAWRPVLLAPIVIGPLYAWIYSLNQREVARRLEPERAELARTLAALESGQAP